MGLRIDQLTPAIFARMAAAEQAAYAPQASLRTPPACQPINAIERKEHRTFENWLILHGYAYRHSRTDKPTREMAGPPDFTVYEKSGGPKYAEAKSFITCARCLAIEFKLPGNKLSEAQEAWAARYGGVVHILATAEEAIKLVLREFGP